MTPDEISALLDNVQGNVLDAFGKDHQRLVLFEMTDVAKAHRWLGKMARAVATAREVRDFNDLFRRVRARRGGRREVVESVWSQLLITASGLRFIGVPDAEIAQLGPEFDGGMKSQAAELGDTAESDPATWREPYRTRTIHIMLVVAADERADLDEELDYLIESAGTCSPRRVRPRISRDARARRYPAVGEGRQSGRVPTPQPGRCGPA